MFQSNHTMMIIDGKLYGWGDNGNYQMGNNSTGLISSATQTGTAFTDWEQVSVGYLHTAAIRKTGHLYLVGSDSVGATGQGKTGSTGTFFPTNVTTTVPASAQNDWKYVHAGYFTTYAVKENGTLWACGQNTSGQLGLGHITSPIAQLTQVGTDADWVYVASTGNATACGIKKDGSLWGWGTSSQHHFMNGVLSGTVYTVPTRLGTDNDWKCVVGSMNVGCLGLKKDGSLWSWGPSGNGLGQTTNSHAPRKVFTQYSDFVMVQMGLQFAAAVRASGELYMWGANGSSQLGTGNTNASTLPILVNNGSLGIAGEKVLDVHLGQNHTMVLTESKKLVGFGLNVSNQLGNGSTSTQTTPGASAPNNTLVAGSTTFYSFGNPINRSANYHLFKVGTSIYKHNGTVWVDTALTEPLTRANYETHGMMNISNLTQIQIAALGGPFKVLTYSTSPVEKRIVVNNPTPLSPLDIMNAPELYVYTESGRDQDLSLVGRPYPGYRYKVEVLEPLSVVVDWTEYIHETTYPQTIVIPHALINQSLNPYTVRVSAQPLGSNEVTYQDITLSLYNTAPTVNISMVGMKLIVTLGDAETDNLTYNVRLNGTQIFPKIADGEFSEPAPATITYERIFRSTEVNLGAPNVVEVNVQDQFGETDDLEYIFQGDYAGLMFSDEVGGYYTDDLGALLKYLDFGILVAGQTSIAQKVRLTNKYPFGIQNINLNLNQGTLKDDVIVSLDTSETFNNPRQTLTFAGPLAFSQYVEFYVRIATDFDADMGGSFTIESTADITEE